MSKKLNEDDMASELAGSAFFRPTPPLKPEPANEATADASDTSRFGDEPAVQQTPHQEFMISSNQEIKKITDQEFMNSSKDEIQKSRNPESLKSRKEDGKQTRKQENQQSGKPLKKFSSLLPEADLKAVKRLALDTDRHDYEVLQEAVETYLELVMSKGQV